MVDHCSSPREEYEHEYQLIGVAVSINNIIWQKVEPLKSGRVL